jgi:hypothetical protein
MILLVFGKLRILLSTNLLAPFKLIVVLPKMGLYLDR